MKVLETVSQRWGVSKSEALRRAIRAAAAAEPQEMTRRRPWTGCRTSLALTETATAAWARHARAERRAGSKRRGF